MPDMVRSRSEEEIQRVLEERARSLARPLESDDQEDATTFVVLQIAPERYGVDITKVRETHPLKRFTPVPGIPEIWSGIVNVRGTLYPLLDLRRYLGLPEHDGGEVQKKVVLVGGAGLVIGLLVDDAPGSQTVPDREIGPPLPGGTDTARSVTSGVTRDLLAVLDIDAMLADPRLAVREETR